MNQALKNKIQATLKDYLIKQGWPEKISNDQILQLLPQMWKKLVSCNLTKEIETKGFGYAKFVECALSAKQHASLKHAFEQKLRNMGVKF